MREQTFALLNLLVAVIERIANPHSPRVQVLRDIWPELTNGQSA